MPLLGFDNYHYALYATYYDTGTYAAALQLYSGDTWVGSIYFSYDKTAANKAPILASGRITLHYHMSMLERVVDLVRNESPYVFYNIAVGVGYVAAGKEPTGEGE